jgi:glucosyl-dolichyl phosphate glucuronosyltransferase
MGRAPPEWLIEFINRNEPSCGGEGSFGPLALLDLSNQLVIDPGGFVAVTSAMRASSFFSINMAIRRDILFHVGGFNPALYGAMLLGVGETGLIFKLSSRGLRIGYVPDAAVDHRIGPERMSLPYLRRRMANQGAYTEFHASMPGRRVLARHAVKTAARAVQRSVKAAWSWNRTDPASLLAQMEAAHEVQRLAYTIG